MKQTEEMHGSTAPQSSSGDHIEAAQAKHHPHPLGYQAIKHPATRLAISSEMPLGFVGWSDTVGANAYLAGKCREEQ
jgi:hypothetical protein